MSVSATSHPTMVDYVNRINRDGKIADIIELIRKENELADVIPWVECNDGEGHKTTVRTGLPTPTWRKLYGGVQPTKSETRQIRDTTGIMHAYAEVDVDLVEANGNSAAWLLSENQAFVAGLNEEFMSTFFYGDETNEPEAFTGIAARYSDTSAENGRNIIKSGTTPDTSMYVLGFGPQALHGLYPKGFTMGLKEDYKGVVTIEDASSDGSAGGRFEAHRTHYRWACGLSLRDWRTCARAQVDFSELRGAPDSSNPIDLYDIISKMLARTRRGMTDKKVIVCNEGIMEYLRLQAKSGTAASTLSRTELAGREVDTINGIPVLLSDSLTSTENTIAPIS
jgi:hypothetical protein|tara:strand:+ start:2905 stop:3918 length:1014 start_codon:yes stop_codon:yes gene_type:complete